jgi:hypothetical protein
MWLGYGRQGIHTEFWSGISWRNVHFEDGEMDARITLKWMDFKEVGSEDPVQWRDYVLSVLKLQVLLQQC